MKVIIAGSRWIEDAPLLDAVIEKSGFVISEVVCGMAAGVDTLGLNWASARGVPVAKFPADWKKHGITAGFVRNEQMASYGEALIAIWDGQSRGTKDMIRRAHRRGLKVFVFIVDRPKTESRPTLPLDD